MNNLKITIVTLFTFITIATAGCKKPIKIPTTDKNGLPLATQTGANTFGCLIDGVPCVVTGGYSNFWNTGVRYTFNLDGSLDLHADNQNLQINVVSKVTGSIPGTYQANQYVIAGFGHADFTLGGSSFGNDYYESNESLPGTITITKYTGDRINGGTANDGAICSGTFDIKMKSASGKIIHLTDGRFDMKR
jgi:hypothetical protein